MSKPNSKEQVLAVTSKFVELAKSTGKSQAVEAIMLYLNRYRLGLFRLVVVGEIKKGKSSFINALLGEPDLLPTMSDVATSTVYKVMYGEKKQFTVFFLPPNPEKPQEKQKPLPVALDKLTEYGTENGNPGNKKGVDFIGVQIPHPLLKSGLVIIDTPGLGGLFREHREITWRYVPNADAVFFVLDSVEAVASKDEMEYLTRLRTMTALLFFVQTKIDLASESQWQQWRERNLAIISKQLGVPSEKLLYFPMSAKVKQAADEEQSPALLEESGYSALLSFLHSKLLQNKENRLAQSLLASIAAQTLNIRRGVEDELNVFSVQTKDGLDMLEKEFVDAKAKLDKWQTTQYQEALRQFQNASADLRRDSANELQERLDTSPSGPVVGRIMQDVKKRGFGAADLESCVHDVQGTCIDMCSSVVMDTLVRFNKSMINLITQTAEALGKSVSLNVGETVLGISVEPSTGSLEMNANSRVGKAKTLFYGFSAGSGMTSMALSVLGTVAIFGLGVAAAPVTIAISVAALLGGLIGVWDSWKTDGKREQKEAVARLQNILCDLVRRAYLQAKKQFEETFVKFDREATDSFRNAVQSFQSEIQSKLKSITEARSRAKEDNNAKAKSLKTIVDSTDSLLQTIQPMIARPPLQTGTH